MIESMFRAAPKMLGLCLLSSLGACGLADVPHKDALTRHNSLKNAYLKTADHTFFDVAGIYLPPDKICGPIGDGCYCGIIIDWRENGEVWDDIDITSDFSNGQNGWHAARSRFLRSRPSLRAWPHANPLGTEESPGWLGDITVRYIKGKAFSLVSCGPYADTDPPYLEAELRKRADRR